MGEPKAALQFPGCPPALPTARRLERGGGEREGDRCPRGGKDPRQARSSGGSPHPARRGILGICYLQGAPARSPAPVAPGKAAGGAAGRRAPPRPLCLHASQMTGRKVYERSRRRFLLGQPDTWQRPPSGRLLPGHGPAPPPPAPGNPEPGLRPREPAPARVGSGGRPRAPHSPPAAGRPPSRAPYWAVGLRGAGRIQAAAGDALAGLCCIPPAWGASRPAGRERVCERVCVRASVCVPASV